MSRLFPTRMNDTTHPVKVQPYTVTVSAAGVELHITFPSLQPVRNSSYEYVCTIEGIEQFDGLALQLLDVLSYSFEDIVAWRRWMLAPSDHIPGFSPSPVYGVSDPVELT